jgi:hypothetical protein
MRIEFPLLINGRQDSPGRVFAGLRIPCDISIRELLEKKPSALISILLVCFLVVPDDNQVLLVFLVLTGTDSHDFLLSAIKMLGSGYTVFDLSHLPPRPDRRYGSPGDSEEEEEEEKESLRQLEASKKNTKTQKKKKKKEGNKKVSNERKVNPEKHAQREVKAGPKAGQDDASVSLPSNADMVVLQSYDSLSSSEYTSTIPVNIYRSNIHNPIPLSLIKMSELTNCNKVVWFTAANWRTLCLGGNSRRTRSRSDTGWRYLPIYLIICFSLQGMDLDFIELHLYSFGCSTRSCLWHASRDIKC